VTEASEVVLSKGLLGMLDTRAELAFVLAHELGHIVLGHNRRHDSARYALTGGAALQAGIEREIEADNFALKLLSTSGYEPQTARSFLSRLEQFGTGHGVMMRRSYPSLEARLNALDSRFSAPVCGLS
jgi:predicted Zn-dependent protease